MDNYSFAYFLFGFAEPHARTFAADNRSAALQIAANLIAAQHEAGGQFIHLNDETGALTVGAGHWQRRGSFSLTLSP